MPILDLPPWTPTVDDIASHLMARTRQPNGTLAGTFNSLTQPTDAQVAVLIGKAVRLLVPRLGDVPDRLADTAQIVCELRTAMMVERSYFTEQIDSGESPYADIRAEFAESLKNWDVLATGKEPNGVKIASMAVGTLYPGYATGTY